MRKNNKESIPVIEFSTIELYKLGKELIRLTKQGFFRRNLLVVGDAIELSGHSGNKTKLIIKVVNRKIEQE